MDTDPDLDKKDVRRPMNAFLIFCKRHRSMVREKNAHLDNRSVTRILGDLWANIGEDEKNQYTDLAKQYKDAFMKANPDYKWHNPERMSQLAAAKNNNKPTNERVPSTSTFVPGDGPIVPGKLADPSNMGGLSMLMDGIQAKTNQFTLNKEPDQNIKPDVPVLAPPVPPLSAASFYPWVPQQNFDHTEEQKLVIDENIAVKDENISNFGGLKQEALHQMDCHDPDYTNKQSADQDDAMYSYGKVVMDHIIDKLYLSTIRNMEQNAKNAMTSIKKSPKAGTREDVKPPVLPLNLSLPPSQGKKSYHTSIAVKNLLEFTRRAAARDETNLREGNPVSEKAVKQQFEDRVVSETKQKLKDFCLKKEGRPKVVSGNESSVDGFDMKEYKRKRCFSESCAELYRSQEKKIRIDRDPGEDEKSTCSSNGEDGQPTRKSRRRNRGQRYQELINEGIIQPSKARLAAMRTDTSIRNISFRETFFSKRPDDLGDEVLSVYPRQIRKRTMSESEKNRTAFEESNRYRTGDFDLEAHIKTLPACSLEKVVRPKRSIGKSSLSESDSGNVENLSMESSDPIPEVKLTVPPRIKAKPTNNNDPVVGSRKRKARKHSITHLLPVKDDRKPDVAATLSGTIRTDKTEMKTEKNMGHEHGNIEKTCQKESSDSCVNISQSSRLLGEKESNYKSDIKDSTDNNLDSRNDHKKSDNAECESPDSPEHGKSDGCDENFVECNKRLSECDTECGVLTEDEADVKFTKLKEKDDLVKNSTDFQSCDENLKDSNHYSDSCELGRHFQDSVAKDQDENSNEQNFCCYGDRNISKTCDDKNEFGNSPNDKYDDISSDSSDNVTVAVSVSVSLTPANICVTDNITQSETDKMNVESAVSICDLTSSSVTMSTLQPSLTCLC